jgi:hypothetical protein
LNERSQELRVPFAGIYNPPESSSGIKPVKKIIAVTFSLLALASCASGDKEAQKQRDFTHGEDVLDTAQRNATVQCRDQAQCDKAWALTKDYVQQHSDTSLTSANDVAIDTDLPTRNGRVAYSATRVQRGNGATITLLAQCRGMYGPEKAMGSAYDDCVEKIGPTQNKFAEFLDQHLSGN